MRGILGRVPVRTRTSETLNRPVPQKPYPKPEAHNPRITLMSAPERFFAKFSEKNEGGTRKWQAGCWEEMKVRASLIGISPTTHEYEMQRLELGTTHEWDTSPFSFAWK